ncbi:MAG: LLM class flavin-dependent oxidoreductase [Nitrospinota bacterium]|nr:LLM class flavin-dependent oxidoreductase [Nitrospinota bacterium]
MRLGIAFEGMRPVGEMMELAREAETAGFHSLWMAEHMGYRSAVATAMALLAATERVTVVPVAISPYSRHVLIHAMSGATLAEAAPGRVIWSMGTANLMALGEMGIELRQPVAVHREYISALRAYWSGETLQREGKAVTLRDSKMFFPPPEPIPILLASMGPKMLRLSGEAADGVILSAGLSPAFMKHSLEKVLEGARLAGKKKEDLELAGFVITSTSRDRSEAVEAARSLLAYLFRSKAIAENVRFTGTAIDLEAVAEAGACHDWEAAKKHISDEAVHTYANAGTPDECRRRLEEYLDIGLTTVVFVTVGEDRNKRLVLEIARGL